MLVRIKHSIIALRYVTLRCTALRYVTLHCVTLCYVVVTLRYVTLLFDEIKQNLAGYKVSG